MYPQSEEEIVSVVREAQASLRPIDTDNIEEMADDILAEEEADDLLEGGPTWDSHYPMLP